MMLLQKLMGGVLWIKCYHSWVLDLWHGSYWFPGHPWATWHLCVSEGNSGGPSTLSKKRWYPDGAQLLQKAFGGTGGTDEREAWGEMRLRTGALEHMILWVLEMLESVLDLIPNMGDITCPSEAVCRGTICKLQRVQPEPSSCVILAINTFGKKWDLKEGSCYFLKKIDMY